jgi:hypothetical protein
MIKFTADLKQPFRVWWWVGLLIGAALTLAGCASATPTPLPTLAHGCGGQDTGTTCSDNGTSAAPVTPSANIKLAPLADMPTEVRSAPVTVQQAYQFAVANPDVLEQIPCYCGCDTIGHHSNYACYVKGKNADGTIQFETHALGCSICVDIALDSMRLLKEGKTVKDIKAYVDNKYSQYGPSNMPADTPTSTP